MSNITYPLTFQNALNALMNGQGWIQGDNFADGVVIMKERGYGVQGKDHAHFHNFNISGSDAKFPLEITNMLYQQNFRIVTSQPDAERRV